MKTITEEKLWFIKRVETFLYELKSAENNFAIESYIYTIKVLAEKAHEKIHHINSDIQ